MVLVAALLLSMATASAQDYQAPKTSYGAPDLQGTYSIATVTMLERGEQFGSETNATGTAGLIAVDIAKTATMIDAMIGATTVGVLFASSVIKSNGNRIGSRIFVGNCGGNVQKTAGRTDGIRSAGRNAGIGSRIVGKIAAKADRASIDGPTVTAALATVRARSSVRSSRPG